jgi:hypothetical protein
MTIDDLRQLIQRSLEEPDCGDPYYVGYNDALRWVLDQIDPTHRDGSSCGVTE